MKNKTMTYNSLIGLLFSSCLSLGMLQQVTPTLPINFSTEGRNNHGQTRNGKLKIHGNEYTVNFLEPDHCRHKAQAKTITLPLEPTQREFIEKQTNSFSSFHINGGFRNQHGIYSIKIDQVIEDNRSCQLQ